MIQARLNYEVAKHDPSIGSNVADFIEIILPFAEQKFSGQILSKMKDGDPLAYAEGIAWMGSVKEKLPEMLRQVPIEEREVLANKLFDAINSSTAIVLPGENYLARKDMLLSAFEDGYYGTGEKWIDNAISLLDIVGAGGTLRAAARSSRLSRLGRGAADSSPAGGERAAAEAAVTGRQAAEPRTPLSTPEGMTEVPRAEQFELSPISRTVSGEQPRTPVGRQEQFARMEEVGLRPRRQARLTPEEVEHIARLREEGLARASRQRYVQTSVQPSSLSQVYRNTNPRLARATSRAASEDETGRVAQAAYGTTRTEAVAFDNLGGIPRTDGAVQNKVSQPNVQGPPVRTESPLLRDFAQDSGAIHLTDAEKAAQASRVINDFNNAKGVVTRTEMSGLRIRDPETGSLEVGDSFNIGVTYGPRDGGWADAGEALDRVKTSLRRYGVKDEDLTLLRRQGDDYVPVDPNTARGVEGDYLVEMNYPYRFESPRDGEWTSVKVLRNFLDRIPHFFGAPQGTINRHFFDPGSMLDNSLTFGANVAVERSAKLYKDLTKLSKQFATKYNKLSKTSQAAVSDEIIRANKMSRNRPDHELRADGFGTPEIAALKDWREYWDNMYWLTNDSFVRELNHKGYGLLTDRTNNTELIAREMGRNRAGNRRTVYDPEDGRVKTMDARELDAWYERGGSVAELRSPITVGGEVVEFTRTTNAPGGGYVRRLRENDPVLNYREGYYTVYYRNPKFVDKVILDRFGNPLRTQAVANAADTAGAAKFRDRMAAAEENPNVRYEVRDAKERMHFGGQDHFDMMESQGLIQQKARGERLTDATADNLDEMHNHLLGPVDSMIRAARSVSQRAGMADYLGAAKQRAVAQYGHLLPKVNGKPVFPSNTAAIKGMSKEAADARTTIEYINSLERAHINIIDDGLKFILRGIADSAGEKGMSLTERAANFAADLGGPTRTGRGVAFTLYLALNPARQFIVQSHQAVQLLALSPGYVATRLAGDTGAVLQMKMSGGKANNLMAKATGRSVEELEEMYRAYERSGLSASIDQSNLVRGSLTEIADATSTGGFRRNVVSQAVGKAAQGIALSRKAGFDAGEEINMLTSFLTHYDRAQRRTGKKTLTAGDQALVNAQARAYTYNMTRAGEMPYNQNFLAMIFQFMQVPHKALLQMTTSRQLSVGEKARLALFNTVWYGGPPGTALALYLEPWLPEEGEFRETVLQGLEGAIANKMLTLLTGDEVDSDYQSMAAIDNTGLLQFITDLWTGGGEGSIGGMLAQSPAGSLFAGSNPRITNFAKDVAEFFHFKDPVHMDRATLGDVAISAAKLSSGMSNAYKAKLAWQEGKLRSGSGQITDHDVSKGEAFLAGLGFGTRDEAKRRNIITSVYEQSEAFEEDVKQLYRNFEREMARQGIKPEEVEHLIQANNFAWGVFQDSPEAYRILRQEMMRDARSGTDTLLRTVKQRHGFMDAQERNRLINTLPGATEEQRQEARDLFQLIDHFRNED
jgi:hypothetical protein